MLNHPKEKSKSYQNQKLLGITTMKTFEIFFALVISFELVFGQPLDIDNPSGLKSKCDDNELKEYSEKYEKCIDSTYTEMKNKRDKANDSNEILKKSTKSDAK